MLLPHLDLMGRKMATGETYRAMAADFRAKAAQETEPTLRAEFDRLTHWYTRLADEADRKVRADVTFRPPFIPKDPRYS